MKKVKIIVVEVEGELFGFVGKGVVCGEVVKLDGEVMVEFVMFLYGCFDLL
ncbi:hypothetical protein [Siminovitchia fortis]|uniref:hypothetical protein n=1 Tax=Siminovitchia fortis TaxID=254758 RepID=UPI0016424832|nr:hypothetical protein [Siminovitchia fortis]